ncbi:helix-turn-helix transcriptional regulator [Saccharolobus solfataricus]|uniref:Helix-turn-helix transcriptional regulator n=1 Tax=Saccharolobus solfataricus TaxID=2287 RepID=A0A7S9IHE7_SACSO|nr:helix-turn-helix transcriptional regulator [Saccharolobus solfataricus]QPG49176.1 helix-turn-helix transcriptional regulator [Saccharolobus solfataricus]
MYSIVIHEFGFYYAGIITKADAIRIIDLLNKKGLSKSEIANRIGITRSSIYQWIWDIVKDIDYENKVKLLDLFYEIDKFEAINFIEEILKEHLKILEKEKEINFKPTIKVEKILVPASTTVQLGVVDY